MTAPIDRAYVELVPDTRRFARDTEAAVKGQVSAATRSMGGISKAAESEMARTEGVFHKGFGRIKDSVKGFIAPVLGAFAAIGTFEFFKGAFESAEQIEKLGRQTAAVLKSTGSIAHVTAKQVDELATSLSNQTGVARDLIQNNENLLLTFTNIQNRVGKGNDIFDQATKAVLDMSVALKEDGKSASIQLGKALNDPIKGITALSRVGVSFTEQQKKQIKTLVESGKTLDAQKVILKELNREFGGSAVAQTTGLDKLKNTWHNLQIELGEKMLPVVEKVVGFVERKILPTLDDWFKGTGAVGRAWTLFTIGFKNNMTEATNKWAKFGGLAHQTLTSTIDLLKNLYTALKPVIAEVIGFATDAWGVALKILQSGVIPALKDVTKWMKSHKQATQDLTIAVLAFIAAWKTSHIVVDAIKGIRLAFTALERHPLIAVISALAALSLAFVHAYKTSEVFRDHVLSVFHYITTGVLNLGLFFVKYLEIPVLDVFSTIIHGAADAFGWLPVVGDKLKKARSDFDAFRKSADKSIKGMEATLNVENAKEQARQLQLQIDKIKQGKVPGIDANTAEGQKKIDDLQAKIDALNQGHPPKIVVLNQAGKDKVAELQATLDGMKQHRAPYLNINTKPGVALAVKLQKQIDAIKQGKVPALTVNKKVADDRLRILQSTLDGIKQHRAPYVNANTAAGKAAIADIQNQINKLTGKTVPVKLKITDARITALLQIDPSTRQSSAPGHATGGTVMGPSGRDRVPIWATAGEEIIRAPMAAKYRALLKSINAGKFTGARGFAEGGTVGPAIQMLVSATAAVTRLLNGVRVKLPGLGLSAPVGALQAYALSLFPSHGWPSSYFGSLKNLWMGESGWRPGATNPSSGAYGIPQALPANKMASAGADWRTSGSTQIRWGEQYIADVYRNPVMAYATWLGRSPHWYQGGAFNILSNQLAMLHKGEAVVPRADAEPWRKGVISGSLIDYTKLAKAVATALTTAFHALQTGSQIISTANIQNISTVARFTALHLRPGAFQHRLEVENAQLLHLSAQRNVIAGRLQSANARLIALQQAFQQQAAQTTQQLMGGFSLTNLGQPSSSAPAAPTLTDLVTAVQQFGLGKGHQLIQRQAAAAQAPGVTIQSILSDAKKQALDLVKFRNDINRLRRLGLNKTLLDQLIQQGPSDQATALAKATKGQIAQLNNSYGVFGRQATALGKVSASIFYSAGIASAQGLIKGLKSQEKAIDRQMTQLAKVLIAGLKRALGIKSPSEEFAKLGVQTGLGFALGMDRTSPFIKASAAKMTRSAMPPPLPTTPRGRGHDHIDYDRLAASMCSAMSGITIRFDGDGLARLVTTRQAAHAARGGRV